LTTVTEGQEVERAEELGYFAFGQPFFPSPSSIYELGVRSKTHVQEVRLLFACSKRAL